MNKNILITTIILISGLLSLFLFLKIALYHTFAIRKWPSITGEITKSEIEFAYAKNILEKNGWAHGILYKYVIDGVIYYGSRISGNIEFTFNFKAAARYFSKRYTPGQKVKIYYNPRDYYESVLVNTFGFTNYILLAFSLGCFWVLYGYTK